MINPSPGRSLSLQCYSGTFIPNEIDADPSAGYIKLAMDAMRPWFPGRWLVPPTGRYNCHGLSFANRRTNVRPETSPNPLSVQDLLNADGYRLRSTPPIPGDLVVYRSARGEITHTGIVSRIENNGGISQVMVLSKWGGLGECEHAVRGCFYAENASIEYWSLNP